MVGVLLPGFDGRNVAFIRGIGAFLRGVLDPTGAAFERFESAAAAAAAAASILRILSCFLRSTAVSFFTSFAYLRLTRLASF